MYSVDSKRLLRWHRRALGLAALNILIILRASVELVQGIERDIGWVRFVAAFHRALARGVR